MFSITECALLDANGRLKNERNAANRRADAARTQACEARFDAKVSGAESGMLEEELALQAARIAELEAERDRAVALAKQAIDEAERRGQRIRQLEKMLAAKA